MTPATISEGATGPAVRWAQYLLARRTLSYTQIDGIFGPVTKTAVEQFQRDSHLAVDGIVGPVTWAALGGDGAQPPTLAEGSHGPVVEKLQTALNEGRGRFAPGSDPVLAVDGIYGAQTAAAVRGAQQLGGIEADGVVGLQTWALPVHAAAGQVLADLCGVPGPGHAPPGQPPVVTAVSPASGPRAGGTRVTVTGSGFTGATAVTFGSAPVSSFTVNSGTQITATSPAATKAGPAEVKVTTPGGTSATRSGDQFTYAPPIPPAPAPPAVTRISPASGPAAGGTSVTITGTGFTGATDVCFGEAAAQPFTVDSATQITATSPPGQDGALSSLQLPFAGPRPDAGQVQQAMHDQAAGSLTGADADVLARNAFALGYVPLVHRLRHGGQTVSWYRGPLAPLPVTTTVQTPISCPDAATRYNPQTGMFDISYAAAWQLGQLLALQSRSFSVALCNWRGHLRSNAAATAEQARYETLLGGAFESVLGARGTRLAAAAPTPPGPVVRWLARLALLNGVPFSYLVPDERMLPPESLRMFHLDGAWIDALTDGAFSVGRAITGDLALDALHAPAVRALAGAERRQVRRNPGPAPAADQNATGEVTGFLLRSAVVAGWPDAAAAGYADAGRTTPLPLLRSARLGTDVMLCLFDGVAGVVAIHEPPGQLHCGVEGTPGSFTTTLREVTGTAPGHQYDPPQGEATVPARDDGRTLKIAAAASNIMDALNTQFSQGLGAFTSAEFALEMVKGVVEVEFRRGG